MAFSTAKAPGQAVDRMWFTAFLLASIGFCHGRRPHEELGARTSFAGVRGFGQTHRTAFSPASAARLAARPSRTDAGATTQPRGARRGRRVTAGTKQSRAAGYRAAGIHFRDRHPAHRAALRRPFGQEWRGKKGLTSSGGYLTVPASLDGNR